MDNNLKIKNKIIKRLNEIPESKLDSVFHYIDSLGEKEKKKNEILSFAGSWVDIDPELFDTLTGKLFKERRNKNSGRRII